MFTKFRNLFVRSSERSDGFHTFGELYAQRDALFLNLCLEHPDTSWWSGYHSDGKKAFGYPYVVVGIGTEPGKQVTYHVNTEKCKLWHNFSTRIKHVDYTPTWGHHTPDDVLFRLITEKFSKSRKPKSVKLDHVIKFLRNEHDHCKIVCEPPVRSSITMELLFCINYFKSLNK